MNILISGTPGTGKTEVSKILGMKTGMKVIHVSDLADEFSVGVDRERGSKEIDINKLNRYLRKFDGVIVETHLPVRIDANCVILRCDIEELKIRLEKRKWKKKKIDENVQAEIFGECKEELSQNYEVIEIDTTGKSADSIAKKIKNILKL